MKYITKNLFFVILAFALSLGACVHDPVMPDPVDPIDEVLFATQVFPLLESSCVDCHSQTPTPAGNIDLSTYDLIMRQVEPFDPGSSNLYRVLVEDAPSEIMPPGSPLPASQIELIRNWIEQGAKDN